MIYTITLNPSLDHVIHIDDFREGTINRIQQETYYPGGKGINVSIVLQRLGLSSKALGFVGGFVGNQLNHLLQEQQIKTDFTQINDTCRINTKIESTYETQINGKGPTLTKQEIDTFIAQCKQIEDGSIVILSGSIPSSLPNDFYKQIIDTFQDKQINVVVDAQGESLLSTLNSKPFFIKPNDEELSAILKKHVKTIEDAIDGAEYLQQLGAQNIIVSLGKKGALLLDDKQRVYICEAMQGNVKNTVGAGDSLVAGFVYGYIQSGDYEEALRYGVASGCATAFSDWLCEKEAVLKMKEQLQVKLWKR